MTRWLVSVYLAFVRAAFLKMLAYRMRYFTGVISYMVYFTTHFFLWRAIYADRSPDETLGGFDQAAMITYIAVGWMGRSFYFNNVDREIAQWVQEGEIASALIRPVSFHGMMVASAFGESLFRLLFFTAPISAVLFFLFPIGGPASAVAAVSFVLSLLLSLLVLVHINLLVGLSSFHLKSIQGVIRAKHYLLELLSGLLLPISLFPGWLETLSRYLPFRALAYLPSSVYLGRLGGAEMIEALLVQGVWVVLLAGLCVLCWRRAARRLTVQGG